MSPRNLMHDHQHPPHNHSHAQFTRRRLFCTVIPGALLAPYAFPQNTVDMVERFCEPGVHVEGSQYAHPPAHSLRSADVQRQRLRERSSAPALPDALRRLIPYWRIPKANWGLYALRISQQRNQISLRGRLIADRMPALESFIHTFNEAAGLDPRPDPRVIVICGLALALGLQGTSLRPVAGGACCLIRSLVPVRASS